MVCRHFAWRLWLFSKPTRLAKKGNVKLSTALVAQMVDLPADSSEAGCQFDEGWKSRHFTVSHRFQRRMDRTFEFIMTDTFQDSLKHLWKHFHNNVLFLLFLKEKLQTQVDRYMRIFKTNRILRKTIAAKNFLVVLLSIRVVIVPFADFRCCCWNREKSISRISVFIFILMAMSTAVRHRLLTSISYTDHCYFNSSYYWRSSSPLPLLLLMLPESRYL